MKLAEMKRRREEKEEIRSERREARSTVHWASGINLLAGIWLIIAPFVLDYSSVEQAAWNDVVVGIAIFVLAMARVGNPLRYEGVSWTNFVLGLWLIAAPFVLGYGEEFAAFNVGNAYWNDVIVGVIVVAMAAWSAMTTHEAPEPHHHPHAHPTAHDPYRSDPDDRRDVGGYETEPRHATAAAPAGRAYADPAAPGRVAEPVTPPGVDPEAERYRTARR